MRWRADFLFKARSVLLREGSPLTTFAIICFDDVTDIDVMLHWDLLNRPRTQFPVPGEDWEVRLLGTRTRHVTRAGLSIDMHGLIGEARDADAVIHASGPPTRTMMHDQAYLSELALSPATQIVASQCSGSLVLAGAGCLEGLTATTHSLAQTDLEELGVSFVAEPLVAHDRVATAAGCLAGVALDEWLLGKFLPNDRVTTCISSAMPWGDDAGRG